MKEVIEQLTPEEATELAIIEARIAKNEDAALDYVTDLREIKDRRLYRGTHGTFETYCQERWGKTSRAIRNNLESLAIKDALLADVKNCSNESRPAVIELTVGEVLEQCDALKAPGTAVFHVLFKGELIPVTKLQFKRNDNELVLS